MNKEVKGDLIKKIILHNYMVRFLHKVENNEVKKGNEIPQGKKEKGGGKMLIKGYLLLSSLLFSKKSFEQCSKLAYVQQPGTR